MLFQTHPRQTHTLRRLSSSSPLSLGSRRDRGELVQCRRVEHSPKPRSDRGPSVVEAARALLAAFRRPEDALFEHALALDRLQDLARRDGVRRSRQRVAADGAWMRDHAAEPAQFLKDLGKKTLGKVAGGGDLLQESAFSPPLPRQTLQ